MHDQKMKPTFTFLASVRNRPLATVPNYGNYTGWCMTEARVCERRLPEAILNSAVGGTC